MPLVKRRVEALLQKTEANGCTPGEAAAALEKAEELVSKYGIDPRVSVAAEAFDDVRLGDISAEAFEAATGRRIEPWTRHRQAGRAADRRASRLDLPAHRRGGEPPD